MTESLRKILQHHLPVIGPFKEIKKNEKSVNITMVYFKKTKNNIK